MTRNSTSWDFNELKNSRKSSFIPMSYLVEQSHQFVQALLGSQTRIVFVDLPLGVLGRVKPGDLSEHILFYRPYPPNPLTTKSAVAGFVARGMFSMLQMRIRV